MYRFFLRLCEHKVRDESGRWTKDWDAICLEMGAFQKLEWKEQERKKEHSHMSFMGSVCSFNVLSTPNSLPVRHSDKPCIALHGLEMP